MPTPSFKSVSDAQNFFNTLVGGNILEAIKVRNGLNLSGSFLKQCQQMGEELNKAEFSNAITATMASIDEKTWSTEEKQAHFLMLLGYSSQGGLEDLESVNRKYGSTILDTYQGKWHELMSTTEGREQVFDFAKRHAAVPELYFFMHRPDTFSPEEANNHFLLWCSKHGIDVNNLVAEYSLETLNQNYIANSPIPDFEERRFGIPEGVFFERPFPNLVQDKDIAKKQAWFDRLELPTAARELETDALSAEFGIQKFDRTQTTAISKKVSQAANQHGINLDKELLGEINAIDQASADINYKKIFLFINALYISNISEEQAKRPLTIDDIHGNQAQYGHYSSAWTQLFNKNSVDAEQVFRIFHKHELIAPLFFLLNSNTGYLPETAAIKLVSWCKTNNIDIEKALNEYATIDIGGPEIIDPQSMKGLKREAEAHMSVEALIAEKQRFFDEAPKDQLIASLNEREGINQERNNELSAQLVKSVHTKRAQKIIYAAWRNIDQMPWSREEKRAQLLRSLASSESEGCDFLAKKPELSISNIAASWRQSLASPRVQQDIFKLAQKYDILPELRFYTCIPTTHMPVGTSGYLSKWCRDQGINLNQMLLDYELPELKALPTDPELDIEDVSRTNIPEIPIELKNKIIDIDAPTVWGDGDELLSAEAEDKKQTEPKDIEYRWHTVLNGLVAAGVTNEQIQKIYRLSPTEHLFDIQTNAGRAQVLVDDHREVFVIRDEDFKGKASLPLHRSPSYKSNGEEDTVYLLDRIDTFKFAIFNAEQLESDLRNHIFTPLSDLPQQFKHQVSWANNSRGKQLETSIISTVVATGDIPKTNKAARRLRYQFGPLAKVRDATHAKGNDALKDERIPMFREAGIKSNREVWKAAVEKEPELATFYRNEPIKALDMFRTVANNIIAGRDVRDMSNAFGSVAERKAEHVSLAIKYDGIPSINAVIAKSDDEPETENNIVDFDSFIEATGLAVKIGDEFLAVEADEAQHMLEEIELRAA